MYSVGQDKFYKYQGYWWSIQKSAQRIKIISEGDVDGPYCIKCRVDMQIPKEANNFDSFQKTKNWKCELQCFNCGYGSSIDEPIDLLRHFFLLEYVSRIRSQVEVESLDEVPSQLKTRDEDDKYFLSAKVGEKDGKKIGVVYFGDKLKDQKKVDYSQVFIDLDDDQVRFDKSNKPPKEILAKMTVEFPNTVHEETYTWRETGKAMKLRSSSEIRSKSS